MRTRKKRTSWCVAAFLGMVLNAASLGISAPDGRKVLVNPTPMYPQLAKQMNISGTVKVDIVIGANGKIKETKVTGGHPVLVDAVLKALKNWRYAPADSDTTTHIDFKF